MAIKHRDFLNYAQNVIKDNSNCGEVDLRNAISRSYYSAYHICAGKFEPSRNDKMGAHERLISGMRNSQDTKVRELAEQLKTLKAKRTKADYRLELLITDTETYQALKESEQICDDAESLGIQCKVVS